MSDRTVKAVCIVSVQVACDDTWNEQATMAQIVKQAEASAAGKIQNLFSDAVTADKDLSVKRDFPSSLRGIRLLGILRTTTQVIEDSDPK